MHFHISVLVFSVLAVLAVVYGSLVLAVGSGSKFFLVWYGIALLLTTLAVLIRLGKWKQIYIPVRVVFLLIVLIGCVTVAVTWGLIMSEFRSEGKADLDYIVVLGAQVRKSGPGAPLRQRLDRAAAYMDENHGTICIVSGGKGSNEPEAEGDAMKKYLLSRGIPEERILVENKSENTEENIRFSVKLFDPGKAAVGIVTNNYHVYRAVKIASKEGYRHVTGIAAESNSFYLANNMLRETFGIMKDLLIKRQSKT